MCKALLCLCARKKDFCGSDVLRRSHFFYGEGSALRGGFLWSPTLFRRAKSRSVSLLFPGLRPYCHQNLQAFALYRTPPGACLPVWCGRHRLPSCPGSARLGGVRTAQTLPNFYFVGACAPEARRKQGLVLGRRKVAEISLESVLRNRGSRGCGDYEHPPVARCSSEPHPLVPFWFLFGQAKRNTRLSY